MDIDQDSVVLLCNTSQGIWSGELPNCNRIQCPDPAVPNFGAIEGSGRYYGDNITFSCDPNYRLLDPTVTGTCTQYGKWSQETPKCLPDVGNPDVCPSGSWPYEDKTCFNAVDNELTWPTARDTCASGTPYGKLAKIPDQATQDFLAGNLQGRTNFYWIGAFEGLKWYWERSDAELEYFSWADVEPNGATDGKVCIQLSGFDSPTSGYHSYDWNDEDCSKASYSDSGKQNFFICEFELTCPDDQDLNSFTQISYGENCAVFVKEARAWDDALNYCEAKGGWLVEVITEVRQQLLVQTANAENGDNSYPNWWVGGFRDDSKSAGELLWLDGPAVSEAFWFPDEPNGADEKCINLLSVTNSFEWNDERCDTPHGYICQYPGHRGLQQCSDPGAPAHGTYMTSHPDWLFGSYVTFSCDVGYELDGEGRVDCKQNGTYTDDRPECTPISCNSSHPTLPHSSPSVSTYQYRSVVVYLCQELYYPVGDVTSVCQADGSWTQPTGSCEEYTGNSTPPPATPETGNATTPSSGTGHATTPSLGTGHATTPSLGTGHATTPSLGTGHATTPSLGTGHATTPSLGTGNATTPSSGTGNATTPSSGTGNATTPSSETEKVTTPSSGTGNWTTPTLGSGNWTTSTSGTGNTTTPSYGKTTVSSRTTPSTDDTITLQCGYFSMTVTIPLTLVGGTMNGEDLHLLGDDDCTGMISEDTRFISITTNLTDCNNAITEDDEHIVYSNTVVTRESEGTITRLKQVTVPFYCSYNRSEQVGLRSYRVTDYQLNFTEVSTGRYKFALDIFKDDDFEEKYADSEYPVDVNLDEELYFGASVPSQDGALDLSIRSCVATPSASYNDEQWTIIRDGCAFETSTHIDDGALGFVAVTINTFRFVELGNRVYIHCDLLVCQATTGNETSECDPGCVGSSGNRDRRDIVEKYSLDKKRITKGPLRLRRNSYFNPSLNDMFNSEENPAFHYDFNPWIVVTVALATICIIIVVMLSVMLRKMTSYARRMKPVCVGDEACEALLGLKTNL